MLLRSLLQPVLLLAFLTTLVMACNRNPAPGGSCEGAAVACFDPSTELACRGGEFVAAPCKGPKGCTVEDFTLACDITGNAAGDPCVNEGHAACIGPTERIQCRGGKYALDRCRGTLGCATEAGSVRCDGSRGLVGDSCVGKANACSLDGNSVLRCIDSVLRLQSKCPGERGCTFSQGTLECDLGTQK